MRNVAHLITESGILLFLDGVQHQIPQDHPNIGTIKAKLEARDYTGIVDLLDVRSAVRKWLGLNPRFTLENDRLTLDGEPFTDAVTDKVLRMIDAGNDAQALFNFLVKVRRNVSSVAQRELLLFCAANKFMIHADGDILAYKSVNKSYRDLHSGSTFYKPAAKMTAEELSQFRLGVKMGKEKNVTVTVVDGFTVASMPRHAVDDQRERTCSHGLHFAAFGYAQNFGGYNSVMLVLKINPADVVSIPNDYDNQKGRTSRFTVFAEIDNGIPLPQKEVYFNSDFGMEDDEDEDYDFSGWSHLNDVEFDSEEDGVCDCDACRGWR